jgi:hypothetical protein
MKQESASREHHHSLIEELICHFPYAILSVALSIISLSILTQLIPSHHGLHMLFHDFHYLHILFSATGVVLTFRKYSKSVFGSIVAGSIIPALFCTLSDSIMPYIGGRFLELDVHFHWCFISHLSTVLPFLIVGLINGFVLSSHGKARQIFYSTGSHFLHILISSMASTLFLVSSGASSWHNDLSFIFLFLIAAVLIPCTLSDIVIPMIFARGGRSATDGGCSSHNH